MVHRPSNVRAESIRIKDATDTHIRSLFRGLPYPKATEQQKKLAARRIQANVDRYYLETVLDEQ